MKKIVIDKELAEKVLSVVDKGLTTDRDDGTFDENGKPVPGHMCVEAAVNFALGDEHGDRPRCVGKAVRDMKVNLNDANGWKNNKSRAEGLRRIAVAQLGSNKIDQGKFNKLVCQEYFDEFHAKKFVGLTLDQARKLLGEIELDNIPTHFIDESAKSAEDVLDGDYDEVDLRNYDEVDLRKIADIVERVLVKMKTPGSKFLPLCDLKKKGK